MGLRFALVWLVAAAAVACGSSGKKSTTDAGDVDAPYACSDPAVDCTAAPACQVATCGADHTCANVADSTQDGMSCGTNMACQNGMCLSTMAVCGDAVLELGEQCDFGSANNGPGAGCETDCTFSCTKSPDSCDDGNLCNGTETCTTNMINGGTGQVCMNGTMAMNGTACGSGMVCTNSLCTADVCGNGFSVPPEECDDGGLNGTIGDGCSATCTYTCVSSDPSRNCASTNPCIGPGTCNDTTHVCAAGTALTNGTPCGTGGTCQGGVCTQAICGDGVRTTGEQCDDGNTTNLDGCDSNCKFEQVHRMTALGIQRTTDTFCSKNALGGALNANAASTMNMSLTSGIADGSITVIFDMLGLDDLSGQNDSSLQVGVLSGVQQTGMTTYNGANDLDWWYTTDTTSVDASRVAKTKMPASISSGVLNAGPTEVNFKLNFVGVPVTMDMVGSTLKLTAGTTNKPTVSSGGTPGHLASEHLDSTLTSFATTTAGELCGNTTAKSLADTTVPSALLSGFGSKCDANYTTANTLLDVYISGCHNVLGGQLVTVTQPDGARVSGDVYHFTANSSHQVVSCTKNGAADTLSDCEMNATYSTWAKLANAQSASTPSTDRVIAK